MKNVIVNTLDSNEFVKSLKGLCAESVTGARFVTEAIDDISLTGLSHSKIRLIFECANKVENDDAVKGWVSEWLEPIASIKFELGLINENLQFKTQNHYVTSLSDKLDEFVDKDEQTILESLALSDELGYWKLNPDVFNTIRAAKKRYYSTDQKALHVVNAVNPIGFNVVDGDKVNSYFDGLAITFDTKANKIGVSLNSSSGDLKLGKAVEKASRFYIPSRDAFVFETGLGAISVSAEGLKLDANIISPKYLIRLVSDYAKLNQHSHAKVDSIKLLNFVLSIVGQLLGNYEKLSIFGNVLRVSRGAINQAEYLVTLDNGTYAVIRKMVESVGRSFTANIRHYDMLNDAISSLTDKYVRAELFELYREEIKTQVDAREAVRTQRDELLEKQKEIDGSIVLISDMLSKIAANPSFVSIDKKESYESKLEQLKTLKTNVSVKLAELA